MQLLTKAQAARQFGVKSRTIQRWVQDGKLVGYHESGGPLMVEVPEDGQGRQITKSPRGRKAQSPVTPNQPVEGQNMADSCVDCKFKDQEIKGLEKERDTLTHQVEGFGAEQERRDKEHPSPAGVLDHATSGSCPQCVQVVQEHDVGVIKAALENMDLPTLRKLAIDRGAIPGSIKVEV